MPIPLVPFIPFRWRLGHRTTLLVEEFHAELAQIAEMN